MAFLRAPGLWCSRGRLACSQSTVSCKATFWQGVLNLVLRRLGLILFLLSGFRLLPVLCDALCYLSQPSLLTAWFPSLCHFSVTCSFYHT